MSEADKPAVETTDVIEPPEMPDEEGQKDTGDPTVDHSDAETKTPPKPKAKAAGRAGPKSAAKAKSAAKKPSLKRG